MLIDVHMKTKIMCQQRRTFSCFGLSSQPTVELLRWAEATVREHSDSEQVFAKWFDSRGEVCQTHTFESIWAEAGEIAHDLRVKWGLSKGDRAILCYSFGLDFLAAFLGCLRAGVLAVPVCELTRARLSVMEGMIRKESSFQLKLCFSIFDCPAWAATYDRYICILYVTEKSYKHVYACYDSFSSHCRSYKHANHVSAYGIRITRLTLGDGGSRQRRQQHRRKKMFIRNHDHDLF